MTPPSHPIFLFFYRSTRFAWMTYFKVSTGPIFQCPTTAFTQGCFNEELRLTVLSRCWYKAPNLRSFCTGALETHVMQISPSSTPSPSRSVFMSSTSASESLRDRDSRGDWCRTCVNWTALVLYTNTPTVCSHILCMWWLIAVSQSYSISLLVLLCWINAQSRYIFHCTIYTAPLKRLGSIRGVMCLFCSSK